MGKSPCAKGRKNSGFLESRNVDFMTTCLCNKICTDGVCALPYGALIKANGWMPRSTIGDPFDDEGGRIHILMNTVQVPYLRTEVLKTGDLAIYDFESVPTPSYLAIAQRKNRPYAVGIPVDNLDGIITAKKCFEMILDSEIGEHLRESGYVITMNGYPLIPKPKVFCMFYLPLKENIEEEKFLEVLEAIGAVSTPEMQSTL